MKLRIARKHVAMWASGEAEPRIVRRFSPFGEPVFGPLGIGRPIERARAREDLVERAYQRLRKRVVRSLGLSVWSS